MVLADLRTVPVEEQKKMSLGQRAKVVKNVVARRHRSPEKCVTKGMRSPCEDKASGKSWDSKNEGKRV